VLDIARKTDYFKVEAPAISKARKIIGTSSDGHRAEFKDVAATQLQRIHTPES
jgi:hypothetical protein